MQRYTGFTFIAAAAVCFSTLTIFAVKLNELGIGTWAQMLVRLGSASVVFTLASALFGSVQPRKVSGWVLGINGLMMFGGSITYLASLALGTAPTKAILLAFMFPVYTALLGVLLFKEPMTRQKLFAVGLGMLGMVLTLEIRSPESLVAFQLGDGFAFANGFVAAGLIVFGRYTGSNHQSPYWVLSRTYSMALFSLVVLGLGYLLTQDIAQAQDTITFTPSVSGAFYLLGLAVLSTIVPFGLLYTGLQYVPSSVAGILMLFEPLGVFILAALVLDTPITSGQLIGGVAILGASVLAVTAPAAAS